MKLTLIAFVSLLLPASASLLGITSVKQATYLHGGESDAIIQIIDVPFVTSYSTQNGDSPRSASRLCPRPMVHGINRKT